MRVLFIDPFYDGSHRAFGEGLARHSKHDITFLTLPGGQWRRRMRLGAQQLARAAESLDAPFDVVVATDMLDLPAFLAFARPRFARTPVLLYMHENQLTYPRIRGTKLNSWFGAMNYLSALAADHVAFNSDYHRDDFIGALATLAGEGANWLDHHGIAAIAAKSSVLPVGVDLSWCREPKPPAPVPLVLWNHRWEFDKAPDLFARVIAALATDGCDFQVALAGDPGPNPHPALFELRDALGPRVVQFGRAHDLADYRALLLRSSIAVSTARHEFFGIGTVEALAAGCLPVAPRRYNYPALVPAKLHDLFLWDDEDGLAAALRAALQLIAGDGRELEPIRAALRQSASRFAWEAVAPRWDAFLARFSLTGR